MSYPQFIDDNTYLSMDASATELDQLRAMLSNLTRIHLLTATKFDTFEELTHEYLVSGIEIFGLETGIVSEISGESYAVRDVISPMVGIEPGQEFPLEATYCYEVVKSRQVLGFPCVAELDYMRCHPVYQNLKLEAYLAAPIFVGDELFGTLNFTSIKPRANGFSVHERNLLLLMANAIGAFILLRRKEDRLLDLNLKMKSFVGYVAHDLRNPLGTIMGLAKMAAKGNKPERLPSILEKIHHSATGALELVNSILEAAALGTGKLTLIKECIALEDLVGDAVAAVEYFADESQAHIDVQCAEGVALECDARHVQQSLVNLLINAIKYSPCGAKVTLSAKLAADNQSIDVVIANPKIPFEGGGVVIDKKVHGSVGFGLEIVREVLKAHDAELVTAESNARYEARFNLPLCLKI